MFRRGCQRLKARKSESNVVPQNRRLSDVVYMCPKFSATKVCGENNWLSMPVEHVELAGTIYLRPLKQLQDERQHCVERYKVT